MTNMIDRKNNQGIDIISCYRQNYSGEIEDLRNDRLMLEAFKKKGVPEERRVEYLASCKKNERFCKDYFTYTQIRQHVAGDFKGKKIALLELHPTSNIFVGYVTHHQGAKVEYISDTYFVNGEDVHNDFFYHKPYQSNVAYNFTLWDMGNKNNQADIPKHGREDLCKNHMLSSCDVIVAQLYQIELHNLFSTFNPCGGIVKLGDDGWNNYCDFIRTLCQYNNDHTLLFLSGPGGGYRGSLKNVLNSGQIYRAELNAFREKWNRDINDVEWSIFMDMEETKIIKSRDQAVITEWNTIITRPSNIVK